MRTLLEVYPGDHVALFVANLLVQVTVVLLLAWIAARRLTRGGAAARHDIWLCALLGVLLSPVIAYTLDRAGISLVRLPLLPTERVEPAVVAEEATAEEATVEEGTVEERAIAEERPVRMTPFVMPLPEDIAPATPTTWEPAWEPPIEEIASIGRTPVVPFMEPDEPVDASPEMVHPVATPSAVTPPVAMPPLSRADTLRVVGMGAALVWAVGVLLFLARIAHGRRLLARLRHETRPLSTERLDKIAEQVRRTLGLKRLPSIVTAAGVDSPITVGIVRPLLILPKSLLRTLRPDQLRDVLLHECAHVARHDHLVGMLQLLAEMLFWPHPLVHVMNRRLARAREEVCDNWVLRHGDGPRYAQTLLKLSRRFVSQRTEPAVLGLCHPRWRLEDRIGGLLDKRRRTMTRMNVGWKSLTACLLLAVATLVAGTRIVAAQPDGPPPANANWTQSDGKAFSADESPEKMPLAQRDTESNGLIGIAAAKLVKRYGRAQLHANAELPEEIVGHFYTKIRPGQSLIVRQHMRDDIVSDAYWCDAGKELQAWRNPPPRNDSPDDTTTDKAATDDDKRLFGRVVDDHGKAVSDVKVSIVSVREHPLREALRIDERTDDQGRFDVSVPLPDEQYYVIVDGRGGVLPKFMPGTGKEIRLTFERPSHGPRDELTGVVHDESGEPVADATVVLVGEYSLSAKARTDDEGRYRIEVVGYLGQGVMYAETAKRISPYRLVRNRDRSVDFTLGAPARMTGLVRDQLSGKPLGGCTVTLTPDFRNSFTRTATADDVGRFSFDHVPPGDYQAGASSATHYEPPTHGSHLERPDFPLTAGRSAHRRIDLRPMATIVGRVLRHDGKPSAGAAVGIKAFWEWDRDKQYQHTMADADGRFTIRTGRLRETLTLADRSGGFAQVKLKGTLEGKTLDLGDVRLSGAVEVRGTVRDPDGEPISGVRVSCYGGGPGGQGETTTGTDGRFDFGRLALHPDSFDSLPLHILAPRPQGAMHHGAFVFGGEDRLPPPDPTRPYFHHRQMKLKAMPGKAFDLDVKLEPAEQLMFKGRVVGPKDQPVAGARVICFLGNARRSWERPFLPNPIMIGGYDKVYQPQTQLGVALTDADGKWAIQIVRENAEDVRLSHHHSARTASGYSFGVIGPKRRTRLVRDIVVENDATSKSVEIKLPPLVPSEVSGRVVDYDSQPISGVKLELAQVFGIGNRNPNVEPVVTGDDGRFTIPVDEAASGVLLRLHDQGRVIQSPQPDGNGKELRLFRPGDRFAELKIVLVETAMVSGTVRWSSGKPVGDFWAEGSSGGDPATTFNSPRISVPRQRITGGGEFKFTAFPPGNGRINIWTPSGVGAERLVKIPPRGSKHFEIELPEPDQVIRGRVVDAGGNPMPGIRVSVRGKGGFSFTGKTVTPEIDGRFKLKVPTGVYGLRLNTNGRDDSRLSLPRAEVTVAEGIEPEEVVLTVREAAWSDVTIEVVDKQGRPLPDVTVQGGGFGQGGRAPIGETDAAGRFRVGGLKVGDQEIILTDPKRMLKENMRLSITVPSKEPYTHRIVLDDGRRVRGRVTCGGRPVGNIHVMVTIALQDRYSSIHTGEDGVFQLLGVPDGKLTIRGRSYMSGQIVERTFDIDSDRDDLKLKLPAGRITGKALDSVGELLPMCGIRVEQLQLYGDGIKPRYPATRHFDDGRIDLPHLADGKYRLTLYAGFGGWNESDVLAVSDPIEIRDGATVEDIVLREQ